MGKRKHLNLVEKLFAKSPVVTFSSLNRIITTKKKKKYAKLLVSNLLKQKKIKKLAKGCYTQCEDPSLAVFCFKPAYFGLQAALSYHQLWEQETIPIILTTKKVRKGLRKIIGMNVLIKTIDSKYFFGYDYFPEGHFYYPYSDLEKTFIDLIVFRQPVSPEILAKIKKKINLPKLNSYLQAYPLKIKTLVLGKLK